VLVSQNQPTIEVFTRQGEFWTLHQASGLDAAIHLESIGCTLALRDVYAKVRLDPEGSEPGD